MKKEGCFVLAGFLCGAILLASDSPAAVLYVDVHGSNPTAPYATWATAATNIQNAVDAAAIGDKILVTNGIYATGVSILNGGTNRLSVPKPVTIEGVNGPKFTIIDGGGQVRCANIVTGVALCGFTLTRGSALGSSAGGGGLMCGQNAFVSNCIISSNLAGFGGGAYGDAYYYNCVFSNNQAFGGSIGAPGGGGAIYGGTLYNCLLISNTAAGGAGGATVSSLYNCTVVGNSPEGVAGFTAGHSAKYAYAYNSIIYGNAESANPWAEFDHCCVQPDPYYYPEKGCFTNDPVLVDPANGDYHLQPGSPCIDTGTNLWVGTGTDLDGTLRWVSGMVDMGSYEYQAIPAPYLALPPLAATNAAGSSLAFTIVAGGVAPLGYQWTFNGNAISGATNAFLALDYLDPAESGEYQVTVTNAYGAVQSSVAALLVTNALVPQIIVQPAGQSGILGGSSAFTITASGTGPLGYQWRFNGANIPNNIISTIAGNGNASISGDGGAAAKASLNNPTGVAFDSNGNLFIADEGNNRVRRVDSSGVITTVAGSGTSAYGGDGGLAVSAGLNPWAVVVDAAGNLYISDFANGRIRFVDVNGIIWTYATGLKQPKGLALDGQGNLWVADSGNNRIVEIDAYGNLTTVAGDGMLTTDWHDVAVGYSGDGWLAANAALAAPESVALDGRGNWFISDSGNLRIRRVNTAGIIETVMGTGVYSFGGNNEPAIYAGMYESSGLCLDPSGQAFVADPLSSTVSKLGLNGKLTMLAGLGGMPNFYGDGYPAAESSLRSPHGVEVDAAGNLYIADSGNQRVRKITFQGPTLVLTNLAGSNVGNYDVVVSNLWGSVTSRVVSLTIPGVPPVITSLPSRVEVLVGGNAALGAAAVGAGSLHYQWRFNGLAMSDGGRINGSATAALDVGATVLGDSGNYQIVVTNLYGSVTGSVALVVASPVVITMQPSNLVSVPGVTARFNLAISGTGPVSYQWRFNGVNLPTRLISSIAGNHTTGYSGDDGPSTNASLDEPVGAAVDALGNFYFPDRFNNCIRKIATNGIISTVAGNGAMGFSGDGGAATNANLGLPFGVAVDALGNLFIADWNNNRVRKVGTNGIITTVAGSASAGYAGDGGAATNARLKNPQGVAVDAAGNLFISDTYNYVIRKVNPNGVITTYAGNGVAAEGGDGGAATNAALNLPFGLAIDSFGSLYIADWNGNCVRRVDANGIITTVAGNIVAGYSGDGGPAVDATFSSVGGVALDAWGNLFIADTANYVIREVTTDGIVRTVVGNGSAGTNGVGGDALQAELAWPNALAMDAHGDFFIADKNGNRICEVTASGPSLGLTNLTTANIGGYDVIVTGPFNSVTSAVASLTLVWPAPVLESVRLANGEVNLKWSAITGQMYQAQYCASLSSGNWLNLGSPAPALDTNMCLTDFISGNKQRFYRVILQR